LPSAEKTANYGLNQWAGNEYPKRQDFVDDNAKIDAELKKAQDHRENTSNPHKVMADQVGAINPNLLINGNYQVWQRGTEFSADEVNQCRYCADRWFYFNAADYTGLHVQKVDEGLQFSSTNDIDHFMGISQTLESELAQSLAGKTITFSASVKASKEVLNFKMRIRYRNTGVITPTMAPTDSADKLVNLTTEFQTFSLTWTVPNDAKGIEFILTATSLPDNETTVTINWAKVEIGSVATEFSPRPYAAELAMCQRYYQVCDISYYGYVISTTTASIRCPLPVTMRTTPTILSSTDCVIRSSEQVIDHATLSVKNIFDNTLWLYAIKEDVTMVETKPCIVAVYDDYLELDAEIY
jgi:hypothetical protein